MEFEIIFKIAGIGIIVSLINIVLNKAGRDEYVILTTLCAIIIVIIMIADNIKELFITLEKLFIL